MNSLSNIDIEKICEQLNLPLRGVYSKDLLPKVLHEGYYIINLTDHRNSAMGHWTGFYFSSASRSRGKGETQSPFDGGVSLYFDSFGFVPPKEIEMVFSPDYIYNAKQIQDITSSACGFFCIAFIAYTSRGCELSPNFKKQNRKPSRVDFQSFCDLFSKDTKVNDDNLQNILSSLM